MKTDTKKRQVRFAVKDRAAFSLDEVKRGLGDRYGDGVRVLAGPTTQ